MVLMPRKFNVPFFKTHILKGFFITIDCGFNLLDIYLNPHITEDLLMLKKIQMFKPNITHKHQLYFPFG